MRKYLIPIKIDISVVLALVLTLSGCIKMSEKETDASAGLNGGFENSKNGLPVNWLMYTNNTVSEADFTIELDQDVFLEGKQSLKFDVKKCSSAGGRHSPGFTNEFADIGKYKGEGTYKLSFWIQNQGTVFKVSAGGVSVKQGDLKTLIEGNEQIDDWKLHVYEIDVERDKWLRMQLNILQPGVFWIDDINIEKI